MIDKANAEGDLGITMDAMTEVHQDDLAAGIVPMAQLLLPWRLPAWVYQ